MIYQQKDMLPKKIYLNYVDEADKEKTWSEEPVGVADCKMKNREYTDLSQVWHTPDEVPQYNKKLVTHCDEKMEWNPINHTIYYDDPEYPWDELVKIYNILHWAYATDLVPNFNEEL